MSTIETILTRAMSDPEFAEQLFNNPEEALASYDLTAEEYAQLQKMSQTEFTALVAEDRKSLVGLIQKFSGGDIEGEVAHGLGIFKIAAAPKNG